MDLVSFALLAMFGSAPVAGLVGFVLARCTRFEIGLAIGLLVFGSVTLGLAARCFLEYHGFAHAGSYALWGEVVAIEDRPANASGSITSPVPMIRFTTPDAESHVVAGPRSGSARVGESVNVIYDSRDPANVRIGQVKELRGAAIALLLFGTFPASFGIWLLLDTALGARAAGFDPTGRARSLRRSKVAEPNATAAIRAVPRYSSLAIATLNALLVGAILWIGLSSGELMQSFVEGFAAVAGVCIGYAFWGMLTRRGSASWNAGMIVLAANFGVWAFAIALLR